MINGLRHVALSVSDLQRSIKFYCNNLDLKVINIIECGSKSRLDAVVGMPNCIARIAFLQSGDSILELFKYQKPLGKSIPKDHKQADNGFIHIGFQTTNIRADYKRLKNCGVKFFNEPIEIRPDTWVVYFYGPDNEVCEIKQTSDILYK